MTGPTVYIVIQWAMDGLLAVLLRGLLPATLLSLAGCGGAQEATRGPVVLAASSLQEALEEVAATWASDGHSAPALSFAATSALARQIERGAPADIFLSADKDWMDRLEERGLLRPLTRGDVLGNELVLVAGTGGGDRSLAGMADERVAIADPEAVPAGRYAKAALEHLGEWETIQSRIVPAENVRAALALVERGEVALGIVYATDALASDGVEVVRALPETSTPIRYPAAVLAVSEHPDAPDFLAFLSSTKARRIFAAHGFQIIP